MRKEGASIETFLFVSFLISSILATPLLALAQEKPKNILKVGFLQEIRAISPFAALEDMEYVVFTLIWDALMSIDENLNPWPNLAERWETSEDGKVWTYYLVKNATWHGTDRPVTAEDVKFSFEYNADPDLWAFDMYLLQNATGWNALDYVEIIDTYTARVYFRIPMAFGDAQMFSIVPKYIWEKVSPVDAQYTYDPVAKGTAIGSGPFKFVERTPQYIKLAANEKYHWGKPAIDELYFVFYFSEETMISALKAGEIDLIAYGMSPDAYLALKNSNPPNIDMAAVKQATGIWTDIVFNMADGGNHETGDSRLAHDRNLRKALNYATDREFIVENVYKGLADVGESVIMPATPFWHWTPTPEERYDFNLEKARQLLAQPPTQAEIDQAKTGYHSPYPYCPPYFPEIEKGVIANKIRDINKDGVIDVKDHVPRPYTDTDGDGIREDVNGRELRFEVVIRREFPVDLEVFQYVKEWWRQIGVVVSERIVDEVEMEDLSALPFNNPRYDILIWYWSSDIDPNYQLAVDSSFQMGWWNDGWYHNKTYDDYFLLQASELNRTKRQEYVHMCQKIIYNDGARAIYAYPYGLYAWRTDKWTGWGNLAEHLGRMPNHFWGRPPLYMELEPLETPPPPTGGGVDVGLIAVVATIVIIAVVGTSVFLYRRRKIRAEEFEERA